MNAAFSNQAVPRTISTSATADTHGAVAVRRELDRPREAERGEGDKGEQPEVQEGVDAAGHDQHDGRGDDRDDGHADEDPARLKGEGRRGVLGGGARHRPQADRRRDAEDGGEGHRDDAEDLPECRAEPALDLRRISEHLDRDGEPEQHDGCDEQHRQDEPGCVDEGRSVHRCSSGGLTAAECRLGRFDGQPVPSPAIDRPSAAVVSRPIPIRAGADARRRDGLPDRRYGATTIVAFICGWIVQ